MMRLIATGIVGVALAAGAVMVGQAMAGAGAEAPSAAEAQPTADATLPQLTGRPMALERSVTTMLAERIARQIIEASPMAGPEDVEARDRAAARLALCKDLIDAGADRVLWGGFHPRQGYHPSGYRLTEDSPLDFFQLTELNPTVWAKLYLSTFMFEGTYEVREEDGLTVLALDARFRGGLDPGDYPYPFWHSPNKWTSYVNTSQVLLVFEAGKLISSFRLAPPPEALKLERRRWDARWTWSDETGAEQPRVALFSYLFSEENPHVAALDASYRALEGAFRAQNCTTCHAPDNRGRINDLLLLNYPNQSLIMRRTLVTVLEENEMPPGSATAGVPKGIQDRKARRELIDLAKAFEKKADAALAYEQLLNATR